MANKVKYKYTCFYCGKTWILTYITYNLPCSHCNDKNIKREKIEIVDYYQDDNKNNNDLNNEIDWRD